MVVKMTKVEMLLLMMTINMMMTMMAMMMKMMMMSETLPHHIPAPSQPGLPQLQVCAWHIFSVGDVDV